MAARPKDAYRLIAQGEARDLAPQDAGDCRCACGSLLGRIVPEGIELKCRRCKRTFVLPIQEDATV